MKVLVPIKRVIDANVKVRVKSDQTGVETANVKMAMNPFCEIAVEQAIRMKEAGQASEVVVVCVGDAKCQETLRTGLAMGADRAVLIETDTPPEPLAVAKLLKALADRENPQVIILGKQSVDGDNNQTGQMLAALLGWSQATFISKMEPQDGSMMATREVDGGLETVKITVPCVLTVDLRLNEPRYASLPNIMKAKKKPLETVSAGELGVDVSPRVTTLKVAEPPPRPPGIMVDSVAALVDKLRNEAKVI